MLEPERPSVWSSDVAAISTEVMIVSAHPFTSTRVIALALAMVGALAAQFIAVAPVAAVVAYTCHGKIVTIVGTTGSETIDGTAGPDVILGLGGYDTIDGKGGDDTICGSGNMYGGPGKDYIVGSSGKDYIVGDGGSDTLKGYGGDDEFVPGPGDDHVYGGRGIDRVWFASTTSRGVHVDLATGLATGQGHDTLKGIEDVTGTNNADTILGSDGPNHLEGDLGNDVVDGRGGNDAGRRQRLRRDRLRGARHPVWRTRERPGHRLGRP